MSAATWAEKLFSEKLRPSRLGNSCLVRGLFPNLNQTTTEPLLSRLSKLYHIKHRIASPVQLKLNFRFDAAPSREWQPKRRKSKLMLPVPRGREWLHAKALRFRIQLCRLLFPNNSILGPRTLRIGPHTVLKRGWDITEAEAESMRFVAAHTTIPVPRVYRSYSICGMVHIEMEYIKGDLPTAFWNQMSQDERTKMMDELEGYVKQLRALPPPYPEAVCAVNGASAYDHRFGIYPAGPFETHDEFHSFLREDTDLDSWNEPECVEVFLSHSKSYTSKFTHGDLAPRNVVVRDGKIVAIIDWDSAGWRPEYWEVTKERYSDLGMPVEWHEAVQRGSGQSYELQLARERHLYRSGAFTEFPASPKKRYW